MAVAADKGVFPLSNPRDLDPLIAEAGNKRIVLLGEASHGTHEYYTWRTAITRRLIEEKGFGFVAVEGDWPDCYRVNRYVKGFDNKGKNPDDVLRGFQRWPTWMWANWEVAALLEWMRSFNRKKSEKAGFYGLDVYSLWESMDVLYEYLKVNDPSAAAIVEKAISCFAGSSRNEQRYALNSLSQPCREQVIKLLREMKRKSRSYNHDPEAELNTLQNAHVAVEAEKYYSNMVRFDDNTWNIRDRHMMDTLNRLLGFYGKDAKAVVWEHNTHVGDANFTDMAANGMFNMGQLAREQYPANCFIVGFGSYAGTVMAASSWGAPMQEMELPEAAPGSIEDLLHSESSDDRLMIFSQMGKYSLPEAKVPHRAVGVVYDPLIENYNYVPSLMSRRYDAFVYLDETRALHPLHVTAEPGLVPDTYPFEF